MLYYVLRGAASVALRWYYADIVVQGAERVPRQGPLVIIANHPNALVDALLAGTALRRRILLTAKATLFEAPVLAVLLRSVGVVPLRRVRDERARLARAESAGGLPGQHDAPAPASAPVRNADTFRLVTENLCRQRAVLVFPEGISHDDPTIAPLKTGAARMALQAREAGAAGLQILPIGLIYEAKERPASRVLVRIGSPMALDAWLESTPTRDATTLTSALDQRLREVTLNFATAERASRAVNLARSLAAIVAEPTPLGEPRSLETEADIAHRIDAATSALQAASPAVAAEADALVARLSSIEAELRARGASLDDIRISPRLRHGARFVVREGLVALVALIIAGVGRASHWLPLRAARALAMGSLRDNPSRDQPAMRTILFGLSFILVWYAALALLIGLWHGPTTAVFVLATIFAAAHADRLLRGRLARAVRRARTYLAIRADPTLQPRMLSEIDQLLHRALLLERALLATDAPHDHLPTSR